MSLGSEPFCTMFSAGVVDKLHSEKASPTLSAIPQSLSGQLAPSHAAAKSE